MKLNVRGILLLVMMFSSLNTASEILEQTYDTWSVYLSSYYGSPPPASELEYLDKADIPYEIKKASVNGADWYRVIVIETTDYKTAKGYAETLKTRLDVKNIWITKNK